MIVRNTRRITGSAAWSALVAKQGSPCQRRAGPRIDIEPDEFWLDPSRQLRRLYRCYQGTVSLGQEE